MEWSPPDPPLQTDRVRLRPFVAADAAEVADACEDPEILQFTFMEDGLTVERAVEWIERGHHAWPRWHPRFAIIDVAGGRFLGQVGFSVDTRLRSAEIYYWVRRSARRRGVASEALGLVSSWAFERGVERLYLLIHPENRASNRLAERMGYTREGVLRAYEPFKGSRPDFVSWSLLPGDTVGGH